MKEIKDYLQFYLGCEVIHSHLGRLNFIGITEGVPWLKSTDMPMFRANPKQIKLVLRPLSDMTPSEHINGSIEWTNALNHVPKDSADWIEVLLKESSRIKYLTQQGFDLFGLIESGLAIDATTLKQKQL